MGGYAAAVDARLARWQEEAFGRRLWEKDYRLWSPEPIPELTDRLGWLDLPNTMTAEVDPLSRLAREVAEEGIRDAVVLGMGGSSLAPEVYARTFAPAFGNPALTVLDSTHPDAVRALGSRIDPEKSLFVVSSKSGTTTEMLSFFLYFWEQLEGRADRGRHFVAVTDPGTPLEKLARERGFRGVFNAPDGGGRALQRAHPVRPGAGGAARRRHRPPARARPATWRTPAAAVRAPTATPACAWARRWASWPWPAATR